jgi:uncharacterized protein YjdB
MKKKTLFATVGAGLSLALAAAAFGGFLGNRQAKEVGATSSTYTATFTQAADLVAAGGTYVNGGVTWTYDSITALNFSSTKGIQLGTSGSPMNKTWTFHTACSNFGNGVTNVSVNGSIASGGDAKVSVTANGTTVLAAKTLTTAATDYSGTAITATTSGELVISFTNTVKGEYFKGFTVTYDAKSYDPVTSIVLDSTTASLAVIGSKTLAATVSPATANQGVNWATSDEFVATVSGGVVTAVGAGTATITATAIGDSTKAATCAVTVSAFGILDLRDSAGVILNAGKIVAVTGTVTKVAAGAGVYIQTGSGSDARAVYGYNTSTTATSATVGNLCTIKGTITSYNGLLELSSASFKSSTTAGETITPWEITTGFTSTALVGHDSVSIKLSSLKLASASTTVTSGTASSISCYLGSDADAITVRADKTISSTDATSINAIFAELGTGSGFSYTGILGWYNAPQATLLTADQLVLTSTGSTDVNAVAAFVSTYVNITAGTCADRWTAAKTAYAALSDNQKAIFKTATGNADMYARYVAWAAANGETVSASNVSMMNESTAVIAVAVVSVLGLLTLAGVMVVRKKHN